MFGARGTRKSTLLTKLFPADSTECIDLFDPRFYRLSPSDFEAQLAALPTEKIWIVADEVQRSPDLLNVVHRWITHGGKSSP